MKHILKKLHIGSGNHDPSRAGEGSAASSPAPTPSAAPELSCGSDHRREMATPPSPSPSQAPAQGSLPVPAPEGGVGAAAAAAAVAEDYFLTEEEFQVQLAMAISASNTEFGEDPHNDQIRAATLLSLGRHRGDAAREDDGAADSLARRYWDYNVLDYDDKVVDGFYDIFELSADPSRHGKMPSLSDLQSKAGEFGLEVIIVNRTIDRALLELEQVAQCISLDRPAGKTDLLVERIAQLVMNNMGGPVKDANDMLVKWMEGSNTLRTSMQTSLIPIGVVTAGLSRHRALLFKVLSDKVGIPCKLVKGSHYTGIDGDALNIIKLEDEREYLVDLMAEPGTLIPADVLGTKDSSRACQDSQTNESPALLGGVVSEWFKVDSGVVSSENGLLKKHGEFGKLRDGTSDARQGTGKVVLTSWPSSNSSELGIGSCSAVDKKSSFSKDQSSQLLTAKSTALVDKEALDLPMHSEKEGSQVDCRLQNNVDSMDLFAELNPFLATEKGKVALHFKQAEKKANGFQRRRENISPGPGRAPLPLVWKNRSACNELSRNKSNEVADGGLPRKNIKAKDHNPSSSNVASVSTSHGNIHPESSQFNIAWTSGRLYSHGVDMPKNEVKDFLTGDSFGGTSSNDEINLGSRINQLGPSVSTGNIPRTENSVLLLNSSEKTPDEADEVHKNALLTSTTYQQEHGKHARDKSDNKKCIHDRFMGTDTTDKFDPMLDDVAGLEIRWEDLVIGERIGLGSYGEVYHAEWNGAEVAVKKFLDQDFYGDALDEFLSEVRIMRRLEHPNVVLFMGAVTRPPNLSIVTEFLPRGSLYRILHRPNCQIDQKRRIKMALDVAKGMNCLHTSTPTIVHRDLKSPNLLVDKNWNVKVCDFGLSRLKHNTFLSSKSTAGTPEWMAPEVLRNEQSNEKCDVYSFGVILWELATLRMPWSGMNPMQVVGAVGFQNRRLEIPKEVDLMVAGIIRECWQQDPNLRPSFAQLTAALKPLQQLTIPVQLDPPSPYLPQEIPINSTP